MKGLFTNYISQKWGVQTPRPPSSTNVSNSPTHLPNPPLSAISFAQPPLTLPRQLFFLGRKYNV